MPFVTVTLNPDLNLKPSLHHEPRTVNRFFIDRLTRYSLWVKSQKPLDKYASERKSSAPQPLPAASPLTHDDIIALVAYDEKTGHLLKADPATGNVDERRIEELRAGGTVLRLLENQLIYPGGKLTVRGIEEARRLAAVAAAIPRRPAAPDADRDRLLRETE